MKRPPDSPLPDAADAAMLAVPIRTSLIGDTGVQHHSCLHLIGALRSFSSGTVRISPLVVVFPMSFPLNSKETCHKVATPKRKLRQNEMCYRNTRYINTTYPFLDPHKHEHSQDLIRQGYGDKPPADSSKMIPEPVPSVST